MIKKPSPRKYKYIVRAYNWKLHAEIVRDYPIGGNDTFVLVKVGEWENNNEYKYDQPCDMLVPMHEINCIHVVKD